MPAYVILGNFTDQGIRNIKKIGDLRRAAEGWVAAKGGKVIANYETLGQYDFVFIAELPSDDIALEGTFTFGSQGEVRTQTLRAFTPDEAEHVAQRIP